MAGGLAVRLGDDVGCRFKMMLVTGLRRWCSSMFRIMVRSNCNKC